MKYLALSFALFLSVSFASAQTTGTVATGTTASTGTVSTGTAMTGTGTAMTGTVSTGTTMTGSTVTGTMMTKEQKAALKAQHHAMMKKTLNTVLRKIQKNKLVGLETVINTMIAKSTDESKNVKLEALLQLIAEIKTTK